jgi:hypothetical protein
VCVGLCTWLARRAAASFFPGNEIGARFVPVGASFARSSDLLGDRRVHADIIGAS